MAFYWRGVQSCLLFWGSILVQNGIYRHDKGSSFKDVISYTHKLYLYVYICDKFLNTDLSIFLGHLNFMLMPRIVLLSFRYITFIFFSYFFLLLLS